MKLNCRALWSFVLCVLALGLSSCSPLEIVTEIPIDHDRLKTIATVYAYSIRDLGRPPKSVEELMPTFTKAGIENPGEFLRSSRDNKPYVIIWASLLGFRTLFGIRAFRFRRSTNSYCLQLLHKGNRGRKICRVRMACRSRA